MKNKIIIITIIITIILNLGCIGYAESNNEDITEVKLNDVEVIEEDKGTIEDEEGIDFKRLKKIGFIAVLVGILFVIISTLIHDSFVFLVSAIMIISGIILIIVSW